MFARVALRIRIPAPSGDRSNSFLPTYVIALLYILRVAYVELPRPVVYLTLMRSDS